MNGVRRIAEQMHLFQFHLAASTYVVDIGVLVGLLAIGFAWYALGISIDGIRMQLHIVKYVINKQVS